MSSQVSPEIVIRELTLDDLARLGEVDAAFESDAILCVNKIVEGLGVAWRLREELLTQVHRRCYAPADDAELADIRSHLEERRGLLLAAEHEGRLAAWLDVKPEEWNKTARIWTILVDRAYRGRGLGRELVERAIAWAREKGYRALWLETQTDNINACRFYRHMGFHISGIRDDLYTNNDIGRREVAIFWSYPLE